MRLPKRQVEFVAGARAPHAPKIVRNIPKLWGVFPAFRGGYSRSTLEYPQQILDQNGIVGIFPEGGTWAQVLRPPRPGTAYLAAQSGVRVVPVAIDGAIEIFKRWRPRVTVTVGAPIGPFPPLGEGAQRRKSVNAIGQTIMQAIALLLPPERRGVFSEDSNLRKEADAVSAFPFHKKNMRGT